MKRLQILIDEDIDDALGREARKENTSKAALIRAYVRERLVPAAPIEEDALWGFIGMVEGSPDDATSIDDVVYPR